MYRKYFLFFRLKATFKSLFWAIFGMGEPDYAQVIVSSEGNESEAEEHFFTEGVGYTLWGLYHLITVVILLNMVIAMMTESYQRVQVRTFFKLFVHFLTECNSLII